MYLGISLGHGTDREAEHWLRENVRPLGLPGLVACTHLVRTPRPHVAISLSVSSPVPLPPGLPELREGTALAVHEHRARRSGRAVLYPGIEHLVGTVRVDELLERTAIDQVVLLGGARAAPETAIETGDFVRPQWRNGELTLIATPLRPGRIAPFEMPNPTPCCAGH
ncbi:hypothetical protein [Micromonospora sp. NPDC049679]|uniref:hypothetical protein n=1 Tax=Micromonospora sp. NPDC049679 TaxID=3155920 RepID=UPI0033C271E4